jgi:hypothetical protein
MSLAREMQGSSGSGAGATKASGSVKPMAKYTHHDGDWIKVAHVSDLEAFKEQIERVTQMWPGRYRLVAVPRWKLRRKEYDVYLKHAA